MAFFLLTYVGKDVQKSAFKTNDDVQVGIWDTLDYVLVENKAGFWHPIQKMSTGRKPVFVFVARVIVMASLHAYYRLLRLVGLSSSTTNDISIQERILNINRISLCKTK